MSRIAATGALWLVATGRVLGSDIVYVGSAGCDWDDKGCQNDAESQRFIQAFKVSTGGEFTHLPELATKQDGLPAWLTPSADGTCLFITRPETNDLLSYNVSPIGELSAPRIAAAGGPTPVHASLSLDGRFLLVANYDGAGDTGATLASFEVGDGCAVTLVDSVRRTRGSMHPWRQTAAHVHSVMVLRSGLAYVCDLGGDEIISYEVSGTGKLTERHRTAAAAGAGPRHLAEHPSLAVLYAVNELSQTVVAYAVDGDGALRLLQETPLVLFGAADWGSKAAEIVVAPGGEALFVTNRGARNTLTAFSVDAAGLLTLSQQLESPAFPRGMALANGGSVLLVAGQSRSEVVSYLVAGAKLTPSGHQVTKVDGVPANPAAFGVLPRGPALLL